MFIHNVLPIDSSHDSYWCLALKSVINTITIIITLELPEAIDKQTWRQTCNIVMLYLNRLLPKHLSHFKT